MRKFYTTIATIIGFLGAFIALGVLLYMSFTYEHDIVPSTLAILVAVGVAVALMVFGSSWYYENLALLEQEEMEMERLLEESRALLNRKTA